MTKSFSFLVSLAPFEQPSMIKTENASELSSNSSSVLRMSPESRSCFACFRLQTFAVLILTNFPNIGEIVAGMPDITSRGSSQGTGAIIVVQRASGNNNNMTTESEVMDLIEQLSIDILLYLILINYMVGKSKWSDLLSYLSGNHHYDYLTNRSVHLILIISSR